MLRIRLARRGQKHQPTYRVVVAEHTRPTTGKFVEILGYYIPTTKPKTFEVKKDRVEYWIKNGAQPTDTVHNLLVDAGVLTEKRDIRYAKEKIKEEKVDTEPKAEAETPVVADETAETEEASTEPATEEVAEEVKTDEGETEEVAEGPAGETPTEGAENKEEKPEE